MRGFISVFICISFGFMAFSQDAQEEELLSDLNLEDLLNIEVTVASKSEEKIADAPSSVTVYSRVEIQNMGIHTLDEFLNFIPGFQASRDVEDSQTSAVYSRNLSSGNLSYHVLILENGVRLNDPHTGGGTFFSRYLSLDNIKQIEVIRGPGSALYGSNAFLGVINIVTVDEENDVKFSAGSLSSRRISANFAKDLDNWRVSAFVNAFRDDGEEYQSLPNRRELFPFDGTNFQKLPKDPREGFEAQAQVRFRSLELTGRFRETNFKDFFQFGGFAEGINRYENTHSYLGLRYEAVATGRNKLHLSGAWVHGTNDGLALLVPRNDVFPYGDFIGGPIQEYTGKNISIDHQFSINPANEFRVGATYREARNDRADSLFNYIPGPVSTFLGEPTVVSEFNDSSVTRKVVGVYIQDQHKFGQSLKAVVGVRYDDYNDFGNSTNPRAALIYSTPINAKFKVMYGQAFRAPSLNELYNRNNPLTVGNPNLKPEKVETIEGAYVQIHRAFQSTITYFNNKITDVIGLGPTPAGPRLYINGAELDIKGLEFELQAAISEHVLLRATYSKILDGEINNTPNEFGSFLLNFNFPKVNFNINGIFRDNLQIWPSQGAYWVGNAKLRLELAPRISIFATALNLFDEDYRTTSASHPSGIPERGAVYHIGASWQR